MAGAAFTTPLRIVTAEGISPSFPVKSAEVVNVGELVGLDTNGDIVVAGKGTAQALGVFIPTDTTYGSGSTFTGTSTGSIKGSFARRARVSGFSQTSGTRVFLGAVSSGGANNYSFTNPVAGGAVAADYVQSVGWVEENGDIVNVEVDQTPLGYQAAGNSFVALK